MKRLKRPYDFNKQKRLSSDKILQMSGSMRIEYLM